MDIEKECNMVRDQVFSSDADIQGIPVLELSSHHL
jgi:hypothetical protein